MDDLSEEERKKLMDTQHGIPDPQECYKSGKDELDGKKTEVQNDINELTSTLEFVNGKGEAVKEAAKAPLEEKLQEKNQKLTDINKEFEELEKKYKLTGAMGD